MKKIPSVKNNYAVVAFLLWTVVVSLSLLWNIKKSRDHIVALAANEAKVYLERDLAFRKWATEYGGIYIKVSEKATPSEFLDEVPDRDIRTTKGDVYTLRNPALMIRELDRIQNHPDGAGTRITSKKLINPINSPDEWESRALDIVESTRKDFTEIVEKNGKAFLRRMQPMYMEEGCLKCHNKTGIKVGELRGATTYSVSMEPYYKISDETQFISLSSHLGVWAFGVFLILYLGKKNQKAEEEIKKLLTAVEQSPSTIVITDVDANIEYVNPMFTKVTGYTLEEVKGKNPRFLNSGLTPPQVYDELWNIVPKGKIWNGEFINKKKNGDIYYEESYITPVKNEFGKISHYIAVKLDITERKKMENDLIQSKAEAEKANKIKSDFLAIISHELRTPIHGILGIDDSLLSSQIDEEQRRQLEIIGERSRTLLDVVDNILKITDLEKNSIRIIPSEFSLKEVIDDLLDKYNKRIQYKNITLGSNIDSLPYDWIETDRDRFIQIIDNLLNNAVKFTEEGKIYIEIQFETWDSGQYKLNVSVKDSGKGMSPEFQKKLFDLFSQEDTSLSRKYGGSGLGLAICKRITRLLGGDIVLNYSNDSGSCFSFYIICNVFPEKKKILSLVSEKKESDLSILIAEDEKINAMITIMYLKNLGYSKMDLAEDGQIALEKIKSKDYDLLLTDIHMPNMTGFELAENIRKLEKKCPVILAVTADVYDETKNKCMELGMAGILTKPFSVQDLKTSIAKALEVSISL